MRNKKETERALPCAFSVGGVDPGGGAGIAADLRAFQSVGAFGCAAASLITVQSTDGCERWEPLDARDVAGQVRAVLNAQNVRAIKVGALGTKAIVNVVARELRRVPDVPVIADPVMLPTSGAKSLLETDALDAYRKRIVPLVTLLTPNLSEAEALTGSRIGSHHEHVRAVRELLALGCRAVLVKGGHASWGCTDILATGSRTLSFRRKRIRLRPVHGGGCTLASLIAGYLAVRRGESISDELVIAIVRSARKRHVSLLRNAIWVGGRLRVLSP